MNVNPRARRSLLFVLISLTLVPMVHSKSKDRVWQDGVLLDSSTERGTRIVPVGNGEQMSARDDITYYQIDGGKMVYVVARTLRHRHDKALDVTINGHVQFAIEGDTCYLRDAQGNEHKLSVEKRVAK
jgi:hypothetical protein